MERVFLYSYILYFYILLMQNITEIWVKSNFKDKPYSCYIPFSFFFRYLLKQRKRIFQYPLSGQCKRIFSLRKQYFFLVRAILLLLEIISVIKTFFVQRKHLFQQNPLFWQVVTLGQWKPFSFFRRFFLLVKTVFKTNRNQL